MPSDAAAGRISQGGFIARSAGQISNDLGRLHPVVLLYLVAIIIPVGFDVGTVAMTSLRVLLLFVTVPLAVRMLASKLDRVYPVDVLFILHVLWMFVAIGVNNPSKVVQNASSTGLEFLGGYLVGRAYIRSAADMFALIRTMIYLIVLSLPFAISESLNGTAVIPDWLSRIPGLTTVDQTYIEKRMGLHRAQVYFAHPIHYGLFCSTALALTFVGLRNVMAGGKRFLYSALIGIGVFLSLSSGALLAAMLQTGLMAWGYVFRNNPRRWRILLGIFAVIYVLIDLLSNRTPIKVFMSYATFSAHNAYYRSIIFDWGVMNVQNNPIFGLGLRDWIRPSYMRSGSIDNFWLVMAVRYGYPGFLLIALGYADALFRVGRRKLTPATAQANLRLGWMIMFLGLSFTLATVHIWTSVYSFVFFLLGSGMWLAAASDAAEAAVVAGPDPRALNWSRATGVTHDRRRTTSDAPAFSQAPAPAPVRARGAVPAPGAAASPGADSGRTGMAPDAPDGEAAPRRDAPAYSRFAGPGERRD